MSTPVRMLVAAVLASCAACATDPAEPVPTPAMQAVIDLDIARHFGDAPADPGPLAGDLSPAMTPQAVDHALRKVADWQLPRTMAHLDRIWTSGVLYAGFMAASDATGDERYRAAMLRMAEGFDWKLRDRPYPDADNISIAQTYLELYLRDPQPANAYRIADTRRHLDTLLPLQTLAPGDERLPWWWCDALFMAPPVWGKLYQATGERKYLDYLHAQWRRTAALLYDREEHLYARDAGYIGKREPNGRKIFWSRGEGWVLGGLARTLAVLPADDPQRPFYVRQLREMAARVASLQDREGLWHAGLLDPATWPQAETSGSALFVFGLAYGVNHGILDAATYRPVIEKAWAGLLRHVYADGRLGGIQQTGAAPAYYRPSSSYNYGVGGFLLAGAELKAMVQP